MTRYRILYLKDGREHKTSWFYSRDRAKQAMGIIQGKGCQAIIYVD